MKHRLAVILSCLCIPGCVVTVSDSPRNNNNTNTNPPKSTGRVNLGLYRPTMADGMAEGGLNLERMSTAWRGYFTESWVDLASQDKCDKAQKDESKGKFNAFTLGIDCVRVKVEVGAVKKWAYDPKTKKQVEVMELKYTATVTWPDGQSRGATVAGSIFQNEPMLKDLAGKVKGLIR